MKINLVSLLLLFFSSVVQSEGLVGFPEGLVRLPVMQSAEEYEKSRITLASEPGFNGYNLQMLEMKMKAESQNFFNEGRLDEAIKSQLHLVDEYPLSIFGNKVVGETYAWAITNPKMPDETKQLLSKLSKQYLLKADLLIKSITKGSECIAIEDQCKVININEEDMILRKFGYKKSGQELLLDIEKKFAFDKITGVNAQGETKFFYFDVWLLTPGNPSTTLTPHSADTPNRAS